MFTLALRQKTRKIVPKHSDTLMEKTQTVILDLKSSYRTNPSIKLTQHLY